MKNFRQIDGLFMVVENYIPREQGYKLQIGYQPLTLIYPCLLSCHKVLFN